MGKFGIDRSARCKQLIYDVGLLDTTEPDLSGTETWSRSELLNV